MDERDDDDYADDGDGEEKMNTQQPPTEIRVEGTAAFRRGIT